MNIIEWQRHAYVGAGLVSTLVLYGCPASDGAARSQSAIESIYTDLSAPSCRQEIDKADPNETPYSVCPGIAGYSLVVRRVDAGRRSIEVVDSAQHVLPLNFHEVVTRHMFTLDPKVEWRVATKEGKQVPIALIVRVRAHEDNANPERATSAYLAVAKITPNEACVTDRIPDGAQSEAQVRSTADSAKERPCAPPQRLITDVGALVR